MEVKGIMELREKPWEKLQGLMGVRSRSSPQLAAGAALLYLLLMWVTWRWPAFLTVPSIPVFQSFPWNTSSHAPVYPLFEIMKLVVAALLGTVITLIHKHFHREKLLSRSLEQAQILLCISGAMMMVIIGDSLPRAFGIAGAAAIIRFRTPVEDPKDTTLLFLVLGIGMACGLGAFSVAGLACFFLCFILFLLDHIGEQKPRPMVLELTANGSEFPSVHVHNIFSAYGTVFEPREMTHGDEAMISYNVILAPNTPLDHMSDQLISGGYSGIKSVVWHTPKKNG
jgi:hypothetical protein